MPACSSQMYWTSPTLKARKAKWSNWKMLYLQRKPEARSRNGCWSFKKTCWLALRRLEHGFQPQSLFRPFSSLNLTFTKSSILHVGLVGIKCCESAAKDASYILRLLWSLSRRTITQNEFCGSENGWGKLSFALANIIGQQKSIKLLKMVRRYCTVHDYLWECATNWRA